MDDRAFTLRPMEPADGPAIAALGRQTPETGAVSTHSEFPADPYATLLALRPGTMGVVAEDARQEGLVGMALMSFGDCWYEGEVRPSAYLYSLSVHPAVRRLGLGTRLVTWRVQAARERNGEDGVLFAGIQPGNIGSVRTAEHWSSQRFDRIRAVVAKPRSKPPRPRAGWHLRSVTDSEAPEVADRQNAFYAGCNLYATRDGTSLAEWRAFAPFGETFRDYHVVVDERHGILAGVAATDEGRLLGSRVVGMAGPLRLANIVLRLVPKDGLVRRLTLEGLWFAPGREEAAAWLWESMRWHARDRASIVMTFFDVRSPLDDVIRMPRWMPAAPGTLVVSGPVPMREDRLIYAAF